MAKTQFQNRVLLVADNFSEITRQYESELHYAILLIGEPVVYKQRQILTIVKNTDGSQEQHSFVDREQPCIVYSRKEDLEANKGTYWEDIPEFEKEVLYEYTATII